MAANELSIMLTAKGNLEGELKKNRDRLKELNTEIKNIQSTGGTVGEDLASEFRTATQAANKLSNELNQVNKDIKKTASESTSAAAKFGQAWTKAANIFQNNFVAGLSTASLVYFGKQAVNTFAEVQDAQSALTATFGAQGDALIKWSQASGDALNLSQAEALKAAQTFAVFGQSAGLTGKELEQFTTDLVARAADLASYFGGTTADAITALSSGLVGQSEPLLRYSIFTQEAALKSAYFALTGEKVTGVLTQQQKVLAAHAVIMRDSERVQGDVARTADSMANKIKDAQQQMSDFRSITGQTISVALSPLLGIMGDAMTMFSKLPQPLQSVSIAVGLIGTAALIATPRIIALNAALSSRGGLLGIAAGAKGAAKGVAGLTVALVGLQAAASRTDSGTIFTPWRGMFEGMDGLSSALNGVTNGFAEFQALEWIGETFWIAEKRSTAASAALNDFDTQLVSLVSTGKEDKAKALFDELVKGSSKWGGTVKDVKAALPGYTAALDAVAAATGDVKDETKETQKAIDGLSRAMDRFAGAADRTKAILDFRDTVKNGLKKPGKDAALEVADAFTNAFNSFEAGSKAQANFVAKNYGDVKKAIENSGLSESMQRQLLGPLNKAKEQADAIVSSLTANPLVVDIVVPNGAAPVRRAAGGLVTGPGTGTSDSIPALLSNGEYVLRAAAVQKLGLGTLDRLNHADKMTDPALLSKMNSDQLQPVAVASSQPLIGSIVVHNPASNVDVEKAVMRGLSRAERIRKERG